MLQRIRPDPFLVALLSTVALASILPARGLFATGVGWLATAAIMLLFFFHGAKLSRQAIFGGLRQWRVHILILSVTFVLFPLLGLVLSITFPGLFSRALWTGVLCLTALPSTVQSSIAFTSIAQGDVAVAVASASASQLLGIVCTPLLVGLLTSTHGAVHGGGDVTSILLQLLAPFVAGHLLRPWIAGWVHRNKQAVSLSDRSAILLSVYSAFSVAVIEGVWRRLPTQQLMVLVGVCLVVLVCALAATRGLARLFGYGRAEEIAIVFCGTKKSLVQGVPMARILFPGPDVGLILLPIMIFHQLQLMACALIAQSYAKRAAASPGE